MSPDVRTRASRTREQVGLCFDCRHVRRLESARGSEFYRCRHASEDASLSDYPPLPVLDCNAHAPQDDEA